MQKLVRVSLLALLLPCIVAIPEALSGPAPEECMYDHHACPPDFSFECCCHRGLRCDLTQSQCEAWCAGQWDG